jgi:hypothetical protein
MDERTGTAFGKAASKARELQCRIGRDFSLILLGVSVGANMDEEALNLGS